MNKRQVHDMICADIEKDRPTQKEINRKGLKKYFSQEMTYEGIVEDIHEDHSSTLIAGVTIYGKTKVLADHIWIGGRVRYPIGTRIKFEGIASNYTDGDGVRKYAIKRVRNTHEIGEDNGNDERN